MMSVFFFFFFLTPLLFFGFWFFFQFFLVFIFLYFMCFDFNSYFSLISYMFGIDFFSFMLVLLTFFITSLMILSSSSIYLLYSRFFFLFNCFLLCFLLFIVFSILNMILMYIFFELTLIPLLIIIMMWGYQPERLVSSFYLFFYTLFGSLPLLCFIFYLYLIYGLVFFDLTVSFNFNFFSHLCLVFAFLVKFPIYMFHFWLPSAHVQAPVSGSMILAGLMLKIGGYGIFRFMFVSEVVFYNYSYLWFTFGVLGSCYVSLVCFVQGDLKCMIAYSSVCHMGLCLCGLLTMTKFGVFGSLFMMVSHGLCSSGLFFLANCVYERLYSRSFYLSKGLIYFMPGLSFFWFLFCCFNMGCPPSLSFISEFLIIFSLISYWYNSFIFIIFISFFVACFSYYLYSCSHHGLFLNLYSYSMICVREYLISFCHVYPLLILVFFINFIF